MTYNGVDQLNYFFLEIEKNHTRLESIDEKITVKSIKILLPVYDVSKDRFSDESHEGGNVETLDGQVENLSSFASKEIINGICLGFTINIVEKLSYRKSISVFETSKVRIKKGVENLNEKWFITLSVNLILIQGTDTSQG